MNNNRLLHVLSVRPFLFLWIAEVFSQIAINMMNFVLIIVAFELTNSSTAVAGVVLSFTIPAILFGIFAGIFVDRRNKKTVLIVTNIIRGLLLLLLAMFHSNLFFIYALTLLITIVTQFFIPAETPIIPLLVSKKLLLAANALFGVGVYGSILAAYALSGPFFLILRETYTFVTLGTFFLLAAIFASLIKIPRGRKYIQGRGEEKLNVALKDEIKDLFATLGRTKEIYQSLLLLTMSQVLVLILAVIGPGYARQILGINPDEFLLVFVTPAALGMFVGAITLGNFVKGRVKGMLATAGVLLSGAAILLLPYGSKVASRDFVHYINTFLPHIFTIDILHIMIFLAFVLGIANALVFVPSNTILQEKTTDSFRGKIYGTLNAMVGAVSLFPIIIVGGFADLIGVGRVLTGLGLSILLFGAARLLLLPRRR